MKPIELGRIAGLRLTAHPSVLVTLLVIWVVLSIVAVNVIGLPVGTALVGALVAAVLHHVSETVHQLGHSIAARRVGYPMIGIYLWGPLGISIYPKDEPALPGRIHIQRALGGPLLSLVFGAVAGLATLFMVQGGVTWWVLLFLCIDNVAVFAVGALLPLGFTDGSTILRWWGK